MHFSNSKTRSEEPPNLLVLPDLELPTSHRPHRRRLDQDLTSNPADHGKAEQLQRPSPQRSLRSSHWAVAEEQLLPEAKWRVPISQEAL